MSKINLTEILQRDINDLKSIFLLKPEESGLNTEQVKNIASGIIANLEDHIEALIKGHL